MESVAPLPLAEANGLSAFRIGLVLLPPALVNAAWGLFAGKLVDRYGVRLPLLAASGAATIGLFLLSAFGVGGSLWLVSGFLALVIAAGTLARVALIKGVSLVTPKEHLSSGISINEMVWMLGVSLGTALFVATAAARSEARRDSTHFTQAALRTTATRSWCWPSRFCWPAWPPYGSKRLSSEFLVQLITDDNLL